MYPSSSRTGFMPSQQSKVRRRVSLRLAGVENVASAYVSNTGRLRCTLGSPACAGPCRLLEQTTFLLYTRVSNSFVHPLSRKQHVPNISQGSSRRRWQARRLTLRTGVQAAHAHFLCLALAVFAGRTVFARVVVSFPISFVVHFAINIIAAAFASFLGRCRVPEQL